MNKTNNTERNIASFNLSARRKSTATRQQPSAANGYTTSHASQQWNKPLIILPSRCVFMTLWTISVSFIRNDTARRAKRTLACAMVKACLVTCRNFHRWLFCFAVAAVVLRGGAAMADDYRADDFLNLDLRQAVLSPNPIGPPARFEPMAVQARTDDGPRRESLSMLATHANRATAKAPLSRQHQFTAMASKHGNPLDAQAFDARLQKWPCTRGGICDWRNAPR